MLIDDDTGRMPERQDGSQFTERVWRGVVGTCLVAAALFLWNDQLDAAFVAATVGGVAWFMPLRNRLHRAGIEASASASRAENEDSFEGRNED